MPFIIHCAGPELDYDTANAFAAQLASHRRGLCKSESGGPDGVELPFAEVVADSDSSDIVSICIWRTSVTVALASHPLGSCSEALLEVRPVLAFLRDQGYAHDLEPMLLSDYQEHLGLIAHVREIVGAGTPERSGE